MEVEMEKRVERRMSNGQTDDRENIALWTMRGWNVVLGRGVNLYHNFAGTDIGKIYDFFRVWGGAPEIEAI